MYGVKIWSVLKSAHEDKILCYLQELALSSLPFFLPVDAAKCHLNSIDLSLPILDRMPRMLRSASALVASWQCQHCSHLNDSTKNKRCCFLGWAWRDRIAPLSKAVLDIVNAFGGGGASVCSNEDNVPNNASPPMVGILKKKGGKRNSALKG
jgi:hypothetical protein